MPTTFLFAGGGTGGHLFPGLAIVEQLAAACGSAGLKAAFICSTRPLDAEILRAQSVEFEPIPAEPFGLRPRRFVKFAASWGGAVRASRAVIKRAAASGPVHMVAMGGFVAAPAAQAARAERIPITLVNLDAVPGRANRWIARHAAAVFSSTEVNRPGWACVSPIVRARAIPPGPPPLCRGRLNLAPDRPTLLVTGASQGAKSINDFLIAMLEQARGAFDGWQVIHQTGKGESDRVREAYGRAGVPALVAPFLDDMGAAWGAADLAVSRAGAGSVGEAWAAGVPTIFMPYPFHKDEHQRANALPLERRGACLIATDLVEHHANANSIGPVLVDCLAKPTRRQAMRTAAVSLGPADGARRIASALLASTERMDGCCSGSSA